jgi:nucleoside-diphosphate-sugar epimerase
MQEMKSSAESLLGFKIIVTGSAGFLGSRLIRKLLARDASVVGLDLAPISPHLEKIAHGNDRLVHWVGDLVEPRFINKILKEIGYAGSDRIALFHFSGSSHVGQCEADPPKSFQTNVIQTAHLLEACRRVGIRRVLFPSTALVYGENSSSLLTEEHPVNPQTIYASTKLAAEAVIQGYGGSYGFSCDIARLGNVYGATANPDTAVSTALRHAKLEGRVVLSALKPVRDFIYCEDVAEGFIRLLTSGEEPGSRIINLSTGEGVSIGQMAKLVCKIAGVKDEIAESGLRLILANDKLVERTAWRPTFSISHGLRATWRELNS